MNKKYVIPALITLAFLIMLGVSGRLGSGGGGNSQGRVQPAVSAVKTSSHFKRKKQRKIKTQQNLWINRAEHAD